LIFKGIVRKSLRMPFDLSWAHSFYA
jgi:hypothetical protein